ncbi:cleavage induced hypothetical protein [Thraustotheca clavata]|uniref:FYVE-type domain-containing protein n=1 Tax=Thraustotheca clavata TaxID=74557 RepID=A0A1V9Z689_9STRA|nr:cleavage induced hypothetical protein [Thraustotheca clavata]
MLGTALAGQHQMHTSAALMAKKLHQMKIEESKNPAFDRRNTTKVAPNEEDSLRSVGDSTARKLLLQDIEATQSNQYTKLTEIDKLAMHECSTDDFYAVKGVLTVHTCMSEVMQLLNTKNPELWNDVMTRFLGPMHVQSCLWYQDKSIVSDDYANSVHTLVVNPAAVNTVSERNASDREFREFCFLRYSDYFDFNNGILERTLPQDAVSQTLRGVSIWESVQLVDGPKDATASFHTSGFIVECTHVTNTVKVSFILSTSSGAIAGSKDMHNSGKSINNSYRIGTTAECFFLQRLVRSTMNHFCSALMDMRIPTDRLLARELFSDGSMCCLCLKNFSLFRHKHHCRLCGDTVCSQCSICRHRESDRQDIRVCGACVDGNPANMIRASAKLYSHENIRAVQLGARSNSSGNKRTPHSKSGRKGNDFKSMRGLSSSVPRPIETKEADPLYMASQRTFVMEPKAPPKKEEAKKPDFRKIKSEARMKVDHVKNDAFEWVGAEAKLKSKSPQSRPKPTIWNSGDNHTRAAYAPRGKPSQEPTPEESRQKKNSPLEHDSFHYHQQSTAQNNNHKQSLPPHQYHQSPPQQNQQSSPPRNYQQRAQQYQQAQNYQHGGPPQFYQQQYEQPQTRSRPGSSKQWNDPRIAKPSWADPLTPLDSDYITESSPLLYQLSFRNGNEWPDAPETASEQWRLHKAKELDLLRRRDEVHRYVKIACKALQCPVGAICIVGGSAGLLIAKIGVYADTMPRHIMLESHVITASEPLIILDCQDDLRFMANPLVSGGEIGIRFYVGIPLVTSDGCVIGVLSLVDTSPRHRVRKSDLQSAMQVAATVMRRFEDLAMQRPPAAYHAGESTGDDQQQFYYYQQQAQRYPAADLELD